MEHVFLYIFVPLTRTQQVIECKTSVLCISSRVNCIINSQAAKRQAWLEFTLGPSLSHRYNSALYVYVCVCQMTLLITQQCYLFEEMEMYVGNAGK